MNAKELTVLMVEPGKHPKVTKIKDDLDALQKAVSIGADYQGLIEFVSLSAPDAPICNHPHPFPSTSPPIRCPLACKILFCFGSQDFIKCFWVMCFIPC